MDFFYLIIFSERGQRLLKTKQIPPHLRRMKEFDQEPFLLKNVGTKDSGNEKGILILKLIIRGKNPEILFCCSY